MLVSDGVVLDFGGGVRCHVVGGGRVRPVGVQTNNTLHYSYGGLPGVALGMGSRMLSSRV